MKYLMFLAGVAYICQAKGTKIYFYSIIIYTSGNLSVKPPHMYMISSYSNARWPARRNILSLRDNAIYDTTPKKKIRIKYMEYVLFYSMFWRTNMMHTSKKASSFLDSVQLTNVGKQILRIEDSTDRCKTNVHNSI